MQPIVSGTTTERIVRTSIMTIVVVVMCVLFFKDGYISYPQKNLEKAVEALDPMPEPDAWPEIDKNIGQETFNAFQEETRDERLTRADIIKRFGEPGWERPAGDQMCYFGPGGVIQIALEGDLVDQNQSRFVSGYKSESELFLQKVIAFVLLGLSLVMLFQFGRVITTRVVLSEDGLKVRGRPVIPFKSILRIDNSRYRKKGYMDIYYTRDGKEPSVRLDDYVIREFRPIIEQICAKCGIENPLPSPKDAQTKEQPQPESQSQESSA